MNSSYTLLGLKEDATLAEAKAAYDYWKKKYMTPDFDDEPEYAKRKISALTDAYREICRNISGEEPEPEEVHKAPAKGRSRSRRNIGPVGDLQQNVGKYTRSLKSAARSFLDEIDAKNGFSLKLADFDDDGEDED